jgi:hypothetical protein
MKISESREGRGESERNNFDKRIALWLLATIVLTTALPAEAQQTGKVPA